MKKLFLLIITALPTLCLAQENNSQSFTIDYNPNGAPTVEPFEEYYPGDYKIPIERNKSERKCASKFELLLGVGVTESIGDIHETSGQLYATMLYHFTADFAAGIATGYYHSVGRYYSRHIPLEIVLDYDIHAAEFWGFTPYVEAYGGSLIGTAVKDRIDDDSDAPTCAMFGARCGLSYNLYSLSEYYPSLANKHWLKNFRVRGAINYLHINDCNNSKTYSKMSENCIGVIANLGYTF